MNKNSIRCQFASVAGGLILTVIPSFGQGTVVYHNAGDALIISNGGDPKFLNVDMDGNGTEDFVFEAYTSFQIYSATGGKSASVPTSPGDLGSWSVPLPAGLSIDSGLSGSLEWIGSFQPNFPPNTWIGQTLHSRDSTGSSGYWDPVAGTLMTAYVGVEFSIEEAVHYGWIQVTVGGIGNGGVIHDWAYNTVPGEMILAGQVPEPSTWALLIGGGTFLFWRCRRRTRISRVTTPPHPPQTGCHR